MPDGDITEHLAPAAVTLRDVLRVCAAHGAPLPAAVEIVGVVRVEFGARPSTLAAAKQLTGPEMIERAKAAAEVQARHTHDLTYAHVGGVETRGSPVPPIPGRSPS